MCFPRGSLHVDYEAILAEFDINPHSKKSKRPKVNVYHKMEKDKF